MISERVNSIPIAQPADAVVREMVDQFEHLPGFTHHRACRCPRCGYDLRGITDTWRDADRCPTNGLCSECGLAFEWSRVFRESVHPWLFEARFPNRPIACYLSTVARSSNPAHFWKHVELTDEVRPKTLFLTLFIPLVVIWLVRFATAALSYEITRQSVAAWNPIGARFSISGIFSHWLGDSWYWNAIVIPNMSLLIGALLLWSALTVAAFGLLPISIRRARVRTVHLVRASAYTLLPFFVFVIGVALLDLGLLYWDGWRFSFSGPTQRFIELYSVPMIMVLWFIAQMIGWSAACRHYLRLRNAWLIAILLTLASGIATALVFLIPTNIAGNAWMWEYIQ